jgi:histone H3/H4
MSEDDDDDGKVEEEEEEEDEDGGKPRKQVFVPARLKRMIQADDTVGKVAKGALAVVGRATELFLAELVQAVAKETTANKRKKIALKDVQAGQVNPGTRSCVLLTRGYLCSVGTPGQI